MTHRLPRIVLALWSLFSRRLPCCAAHGAQAAPQQDPAADFRTSSRCITCHNNLKTAKGEDVSIGMEWRAGIMANSARDPYWQGSVRRETTRPS